MKMEELRSGQLVQTGTTLYRVSSLRTNGGSYGNDSRGYVTLQQVYPKLERTSVRSMPAPEADSKLAEPTANIVARYESAWGFAPGSSKKYGEV